MSATRTAGRREPRPPGPGTSRTSRTSRTSGAPRTARTTSRRTRSAPAPAPVAPAPVDTAPRVEVDPAGTPTRRTRRSRTAGPVGGRSPRHRILLACTAALAAGFFAVLLLNTVISQGAFRQNELEIQLILLAEKEESLARAVQLAESPIEVERAARKLGMVPAAAPVFLSLSDGKVLGEPVPAVKEPGPVSFAGAPGIQPTPRPTPSASGTDLIDPALDPATGLDAPADPATGSEAQGTAGGLPVDEASPAAQASPEAVPAQQGVNP